MIMLRVTLSILVMLIALFIVVANWGCVITSEMNKRRGIDRHHSVAPVISLLLVGLIAVPLYPWTPKWWMWILPAVDIGTWMFVVGFPWALAKGMFKRDKPSKEE